MRYWDLYDVLLRNIYVYARKEYDYDILDLFSVFKWTLLKSALVASISKVDTDRLTNEEYIAECAERFKEVVKRAKWLEITRKFITVIHDTIEEIYEKTQKLATKKDK